MEERELVVSRMKTPDGTILTSKHRHDYQTHTDKNGEVYFLDGGRDYQRTSVNKENMEDVSLYTDSPFEEIRKALEWGTFDKDGYRVFKPICELSDEHLRNIIIYNSGRGMEDTMINSMIKKELMYRDANKITIPDNR
jgi:hypothetical protein